MNFLNLITSLNKSMLADYCCVNFDSNPISKNLKSYDKENLIYVLTQYSFFSKRIVSFFLPAFYLFKYHKWDYISEELVQNISEELSLETHDNNQQNYPHFVLLVDGFKKSFNIDLFSANQSKETEIFLNTIAQLMGNTQPSYVAGCVYALESSAVPELSMVYKFVDKIYKDSETEIHSNIKLFFESHINSIEIEHENRLKEQCAKYILNDTDFRSFSAGFRDVLQNMDQWWEEMYKKSNSYITD